MMKKNTVTKFLSVLLTALMLLSAFAVIPVSAEESVNTAEASQDGKVLWSLDFDDYTSGTTLTTYLAGKGINASGLGATTVKNGKLDVPAGYQPYHNAKTEDAFRDLFYGLYKNSDGSYLTDYYMDVDYTLKSSNDTTQYIAPNYFETTVDGKTVKYTIHSPYRGNSYFNPVASSAYFTQWLFKVSPTGYLYTPYESGNLTSVAYETRTFTTADGGDGILEYFTYSMTVDGVEKVKMQPVTKAVWEQMRAEAGTAVTLSGYTNIPNLTKNNSYQLELNKEYTIRVKFSVDSTQTVVTTTYVRPADSDEPFVEVGQAKFKCSDAGKGEKTDAIRFGENFQAFTFDNMKFVRAGKCAGEHEFPVVVSSSENENGFETCDLMRCVSCGEEWYNYSEQTTVQDYDFTTMTSDEYTAFYNAWKSAATDKLTFEQGEGIAFSVPSWATTSQSGPDLALKTPIKDKDKDYRVTFTAKINTIPVDQVNSGTTTPGSSFFTDRVGGNGFNVLLRMGRNADYDTTKQGWLKMRNSSGQTNWGSYDSLFTIKEGETYTFSLVLRPSVGKYDVYIDGNYAGTGGLNTWDGRTARIFRIGNQMSLNMLLEDYSIAVIESEQTYTLLNGSDYDFSLVKDTLKFTNNATHGAIASNYINPKATTQSTTLYLEDNDFVLGSTPYTLSFDFVMSDKGGYKDSQSTSADLWSFVSWLNSASATGNPTYSTMVRIGGIDNDTTKAGFEKFFVVMNNNGDATVTQNNGNQSYTATVDGEPVTYYYSDHNAVYTFEAGEWVTFTVAVNPVTASAYLYANGELVGSAPTNAFGKTAGTAQSRLRIGDDFRKFEYNWAIKDISLELTPDTPVDVKDSGTIFNMDFGGTYKVNTGTTYMLGSTYHNAVSANATYKDSDTVQGYVNFIGQGGSYAAGATNLFNLSLTSKIGTDKYYNHTEGAKYSIQTKFALYNRAPTQAEKDSLSAYNTANNKTYTLPTTLSKKEVNVLRMSKYHDNNAVHLIKHPTSGLTAVTMSGDIALYTVDASGAYVRPSAWYTASDLVDGRVPESKFVKVEVVVDESNDTFSVYVNDRVAFYKDGDTYKRAVDLEMKVTTGSNSLTTKYPDAPESEAWVDNGKLYKDIPREVNDPTAGKKNYGTSGLSVINYVRFFQNALDFCVQNVKITKIEDGLNYIGSQIRTESETPLAFDVRFVFGTDDIYVDSIEYDVSVDVDGVSRGEGETAVSNTVYRSIYSSVGDVKSWKIGEGDYFSAFSVDGVELGTESTEYTFRITPYLKEYNAASGKIERNLESATVTHVIKINGLGKVLSYDTEDAEWVTLKTVYTPIASVPYKALGRTQYLDSASALTADWSAAGIEFTANCIGDVSIDLTMTQTRLFTLVIDGVQHKNVALKNGVNVIATGLSYGEHTFKIMNQGGYSGKVDIKGITLRGTFGTKPADSTLLIEFIGDSVTHGCGLGSPNYSSGTNDGTLTYAFTAAQLLGADYTIMANGGMGVKWGGDYDSANVNHSMAKYPYLNDTNRKGIEYDGYGERKADIAVIGLSTNDNYRFQLQYTDKQRAFKASNTSATDEEVAAYMDNWKANNANATDAQIAKAELTYKASKTNYSDEEIAAHMAEFKDAKLAELGEALEALIAKIVENHGDDVSIILARGMMEQTLENDYPNADTDEEIAAAKAAMELYHTSVTYMTDLIENRWKGQYEGHKILVAHLTPDRTGYEGHPTREGAAQQGKDLAEFIITKFADLVSQD